MRARSGVSQMRNVPAMRTLREKLLRQTVEGANLPTQTWIDVCMALQPRWPLVTHLHAQHACLGCQLNGILHISHQQRTPCQDAEEVFRNVGTRLLVTLARVRSIELIFACSQVSEKNIPSSSTTYVYTRLVLRNQPMEVQQQAESQVSSLRPLRTPFPSSDKKSLPGAPEMWISSDSLRKRQKNHGIHGGAILYDTTTTEVASSQRCSLVALPAPVSEMRTNSIT